LPAPDKAALDRKNRRVATRQPAAAERRENAGTLSRLAPGAGAPGGRMSSYNYSDRSLERKEASPRGGLGFVFDELNKVGFMARGYHDDPSWYNPRGSMGAIFGIQKRF
jgi:hypothetical protein